MSRTTRRALFVVWLLLPAVALAYHYGPGQDRLRADDAALLVGKARASADRAREVARTDGDAAAREHWAAAEAALAEAIPLLPGDSADAVRAARLERARAWMHVSRLPEARAALEVLVDELEGDPAADGSLLRDARAALAESRFYVTWLLRLEGATREEWEPEIDAARQGYKLLHEEAAAAGDESFARESRESLDATIRLARLDLEELQGLPLPSQ
jgi:hypothetical protein